MLKSFYIIMGWSRRLDGSRPPKSGLFVEIVPEKRFFENIKTSFLRIYNKCGFGKSGGGACLVGKILLHPVGVFLSYLEAPSSHIVKKICLLKIWYFSPHSYQLMLGLLVCIYFREVGLALCPWLEH